MKVRGWDAAGWAPPDVVAAGLPAGRHRTTLLSPFDSLVWDRARTARIFGLDHRLEAYVPKELRQHGYFAMPVLAGGRIIARVDPAREGSTLIARHVTVMPQHATPAKVEATAGPFVTRFARRRPGSAATTSRSRRSNRLRLVT